MANGRSTKSSSISPIGNAFGAIGRFFARREGSVPEGHEENIMAANSNADELPLEQIIAQLRAVHLATKALFDGFNQQILETTCKFYDYEMSILAIGFVIISHQIHHFGIIEERYFPLDK